ncbi:hypothetical protein D3C78_1182700 [compost metagenome]
MRHKVVMAQRGFHLTEVGVGDHRVLGHFAAGTGGGRNGDQRQGGTADFRITDLFHIAQGGQRVLHQGGERLGGIQHAATADGDDTLGFSAPACHPGVNLLR